ncbi:hypothetical protein [Sporomusa aerivorans]|uniref:hypothetical protein n=1 Tax=Sporomusa aerivorans TaxID=204936 RepID=UPI00352AEF9F
MYISLYDLGLFILFAVLVTCGIYLIAVLRRVLCMLNQAQGILNAHQGDIGKTVSMFQETLININALTVTLQEATAQTTSAVRALPSEITETVEDLRESFETFALYARIAGEVVKSVFSK